jgi:HAD superfamily hydrolase (TIGR01509 family)
MAICSLQVGRLADLDAVTLDANGTLIRLVDPVPKLDRLLREHGIERPEAVIRRAFDAEGAVYATRSVEARDAASFATVQHECTGVFLEEVQADRLSAAEFAASYVGAMEFELVPHARESLRRLRRLGLALAVVANFDLTLHKRLGELGLVSEFSAIVTPVEAGAGKPDPWIFELALDRLGVSAGRALHIGDSASDEEGARAAGMKFAWAPIRTALESWR